MVSCYYNYYLGCRRNADSWEEGGVGLIWLHLPQIFENSGDGENWLKLNKLLNLPISRRNKGVSLEKY